MLYLYSVRALCAAHRIPMVGVLDEPPTHNHRIHKRTQSRRYGSALGDCSHCQPEVDESGGRVVYTGATDCAKVFLNRVH